MNERLTIQDLTDLLAAKHSMTKKDAEGVRKRVFSLDRTSLGKREDCKNQRIGNFQTYRCR